MVSLRAGALVGAIAVLAGASIHARSGVALVDVMLAVVASEAFRAQASEAVDAIHTCATIKTRALSTVRCVVLAVNPTESRWTGAGVAVHTISAVGAVFTRVTLTFVNVLLTSAAPETRQAGASEGVHCVFAEATVTAGVGLAVIDVCLTVATRVARFATALVAANGVLADGVISARIFNTLVDVHLTCLALPSRRTHTREALVVFRFLANASVLTGFRAARGQQGLTVLASVRKQTVAFVSGHIINAGSLIQAWVGGTFVDIRLAIGTAEAGATCADVATGHVLTSASIHTGVGLALVVVNVTVDSTPARVANTVISIDFVFTVSMDTGVAEAFVEL